MVISRDQLKPPTLPKETIPCPELGGDVVIRGPLASARIALQRMATADSTVEKLAPVLLASSVVDKDDKPLFTEEQWDAWGGSNYTAYLTLFNAAMRLWGFDREENRKN
jgi:hypothetical protein